MTKKTEEKPVEKPTKKSVKKPVAKLNKLQKLKKLATKIAKDDDFVPFSLGALSGGVVLLFIGLFAGSRMAGPSCPAEAKLAAAQAFCENLIEKAVTERCSSYEGKDAKDCKAYIRDQASSACSELAELPALEQQAAETCQ